MDYLDLSSGAAHFTSPQGAIEKTIRALQQNETFYGEPKGLPALCQAISKRYSEDYNTDVPSENILITSGTKQALFNLLSVLLEPGDEVILPQPSWFSFPELFHLTNAKPVYWETYTEENYALQPEKLEALLNDKTRIFIFTNPNNPTGRIYTEAEIAALLKVLENYPQVKILSDEIYDLVIYDDVKMPSIVQFPEAQDKALLVNGFSKNFAMSGWRIGYLIAPPDVFEMSLHFQQHTISGVNPFIQEGAVAALENRKEYLEKSITELSQNREMICNWLDKQPDIGYFKPQGTYYIFTDFRKLLQTENCHRKNISTSQQLCDYLKETYNLEFQPGERFERPGFARITFGVSSADLQEALGRLDLFLTDN